MNATHFITMRPFFVGWQVIKNLLTKNKKRNGREKWRHVRNDWLESLNTDWHRFCTIARFRKGLEIEFCLLSSVTDLYVEKSSLEVAPTTFWPVLLIHSLKLRSTFPPRWQNWFSQFQSFTYSQVEFMIYDLNVTLTFTGLRPNMMLNI